VRISLSPSATRNPLPCCHSRSGLATERAHDHASLLPGSFTRDIQCDDGIAGSTCPQSTSAPAMTLVVDETKAARRIAFGAPPNSAGTVLETHFEFILVGRRSYGEVLEPDFWPGNKPLNCRDPGATELMRNCRHRTRIRRCGTDRLAAEA
jgi:hypothetical protein